MPRSNPLVSSALEILEARIAPAAVVTFVEADGDTVKVSTSKGTVVDLNSVVTTTNGHLALLDFVTDPSFATKFAGSTLSITVSAIGAMGDGVVNVGYINATGFSLGAVTVKGDLGKISAGSSDTKPGVASLTVNSLGALGTSSGAPDNNSVITGNLGPLKVFGDIDEAALLITGKLASATVGGSLDGGAGAGTGSITVMGASGAIKIGGDLEGGSGDKTGSLILSTSAKNGAITINGNLVGDSGVLSGSVRGGNLSTIFVGGGLTGGSVSTAGTIAAGTFTSITVSGDVSGGTADGSGIILVAGPGGSITVGGSLYGGSGPRGGLIGESGPGLIGSITVKGSLTAGTDHDTGEIAVNTVGSISVGGSLYGGGAAAVDGGTIQAGNVKSITVGGSLVGNAGAGGGSLLFLTATSVKVGGGMTGQLAAGSGTIKARSVGSLDVGGSLFQTYVILGVDETPDNTLVAKTVHIGGSVASSYLAFGNFERANVTVGTVQIDGSWTTSDLVVGAVNIPGGVLPNNVNFGDANDAFAATGVGAGLVIPSIASITIEGAITGTNGGTDHYGFVAGKIGAFRAGSIKVPLKANAGNDQIDLATTLDVTIHEIGATALNAAPAAPALPHAVASAMFTDIDGDVVRITSTKGTNLDLQNALTLAPQGPGAQLQRLDLSAATYGQKFNGASISISVVTLGAHGNGVVDVGEIDATGITLGGVTVKGDLGRINAGTLANKPAIGSLTLDSLGLRLTSTGAPDLNSVVNGNLGPVKIFGDVLHASLSVNGTIGTVTIGGSFVGGANTGEGSLTVQGNAGAVKIGGALYGGTADSTGSIDLNANVLAGTGKVASIFIGGDVAGGDGVDSGMISAGAVGAVTIGGNLGGGSVTVSGGVNLGSATSFALGGDLSGGSASSTGFVNVTHKSGAFSIGGNIGGSSNSSGTVTITAPITTFTVQGTIRNGANDGSGAVVLADATSIFVGGTVFGSGAATSAVATGGITAGKVGTVTINGSLIGGGGGTSGTLTLASATTLKILGDVSTFVRLDAGNVHVTQSVGTLDIGGIVQNATMLIGSADSKAGSMVAAKVHVGGSVITSNFFFGSLDRADVKVGTVAIDGHWAQSNLIAGTVNLGTDDAPGGNADAADNVNFGDGHDHRAANGSSGVPSSIASIIVEGRVSGTVGGTDHFGFVANKITAFRAGSITFPLHATGAPDTVTFSGSGDVSVTEQVV